MLQARLLGKILKEDKNIFNGLNVLCASDLNRAQHTVLQLFHGHFRKKSNLFELKEEFHNNSIVRFHNFIRNRRDKEKIFEKEIDKIFKMEELPKMNISLTDMLKLISNNGRAQSVIEKPTTNKVKIEKKTRAESAF